MKLKQTLLTLSAAAMIAAPVAAQAGTTAAASVGKISNLSGVGERRSTDVKAKQKADGTLVVVGLLAAGAAGFGIYKAVDDDKSNGS
ncbi:hypothetical protein [Novosphingobium resinovorum]|uniref:hypothetical protein n=1 Tax=Novosphingobium resinovorum TaxID=158500 RepID=UPI002ECFB341|nr:hypothetical protein [Novosphingobium resinovorum]